ncbi:hypothetical protein M408DRAFT_329175 [Serendipita vermifera MAFF 305830]|uniref:Peptidase M3A/M3B catalytic domain-containing protein n=1 Tax=Serendipita vermifera MAFF 305830 TaxID=933852 RepID=A0A0C2XHZ9_SERVB|nr:hypothetical protein M408DRAFT_329175 [Serendipita vermifera MAFF 305830]
MSTADNNPRLTPPQPAIKWNHTPELIKTKTDEEITANRQALDSIANLPKADCNFQSVFEAITKANTVLSKETSPLIFYTHVTPNDDLRAASIAAEETLDKYSVEAEMRVDVYRSVLNAEENIKETNPNLTPEQRRLVEKTVLEGKRAGLGLPETERGKLKTLKEELAKACQDFSNNCNQEKGYMDFTVEQLRGVPQKTIDGYKKVEDDKVRVTFKTPDTVPVMKYAELPETRKAMFAGSEDRLKINVPVMDKVLDLRRQCTELLGYDTWAQYVLEDRMIKSPEKAAEFLEDLREKLHPVGVADRKALLELKKSECERLNIPFDNELYVWDWRYYDRLYAEKTVNMDNEFIKAHFPANVVIPAVLDIYKQLLNVRIEEVPNAVVWHEDVKQYAAWDLDATDQSGFLGYLHLDLFPRQNKYGHAAVWGLISGYETDDGGRSYPVTCMVANLAKPTDNDPGLLSHDDVVTFFHEMGHAWHGLLSRTKYARFHGTSVSRDFVEAPSQMLENWCFERVVLEKISRHHETQLPLPDEAIESIIKSRYLDVGLFYLRQVYIGMFDQALHTSKEKINATEKWNELRETISLVKGFEKAMWKPGFGSVGHLVGGYDAQYYGYAYSLVIAYDMYETIFKADPLSPAAGKRYRDSILKPGGSRDELASVEEFLGRPYNAEAFQKALFNSDASSGSHL